MLQRPPVGPIGQAGYLFKEFLVESEWKREPEVLVHSLSAILFREKQQLPESRVETVAGEIDSGQRPLLESVPTLVYLHLGGVPRKPNLLPVPFPINQRDLGEIPICPCPGRGCRYEVGEIDVREFNRRRGGRRRLDQEAKPGALGLLDDQIAVSIVPRNNTSLFGIFRVFIGAERPERHGLARRLIITNLEPDDPHEDNKAQHTWQYKSPPLHSPHTHGGAPFRDGPPRP